ncbi:unnamed protein product [Closterium sp. NIES-65]|nr:unnamed protein product [Closterium sp. NIES-65]
MASTLQEWWPVYSGSLSPPTSEAPPTEQTAWIKKNAEAYLYLPNSVQDQYAKSLLTCASHSDSAKRAWERLTRLHQPRTESTKAEMWGKISNLRMEQKETIPEYLERAEILLNDADVLEVTVPEKLFITILLAGLSSEWIQMRSTIQAFPEKQKTRDFIFNTLINEHQTRELAKAKEENNKPAWSAAVSTQAGYAGLELGQEESRRNLTSPRYFLLPITLFPAFISSPYCSPLMSALLVAQFSLLSPLPRTPPPSSPLSSRLLTAHPAGPLCSYVISPCSPLVRTPLYARLPSALLSPLPPPVHPSYPLLYIYFSTSPPHSPLHSSPALSASSPALSASPPLFPHLSPLFPHLPRSFRIPPSPHLPPPPPSPHLPPPPPPPPVQPFNHGLSLHLPHVSLLSPLFTPFFLPTITSSSPQRSASPIILTSFPALPSTPSALPAFPPPFTPYPPHPPLLVCSIQPSTGTNLNLNQARVVLVLPLPETFESTQKSPAFPPPVHPFIPPPPSFVRSNLQLARILT